MKHIRELKTRWQIRFANAALAPREVSFAFRKADYSPKEIQHLREELYVEWRRGRWDPWTRRLPGKETPARQIGRASCRERV